MCRFSWCCCCCQSSALDTFACSRPPLSVKSLKFPGSFSESWGRKATQSAVLVRASSCTDFRSWSRHRVFQWLCVFYFFSLIYSPIPKKRLRCVRIHVVFFARALVGRGRAQAKHDLAAASVFDFVRANVIRVRLTILYRRPRQAALGHRLDVSRSHAWPIESTRRACALFLGGP